MAAQVQINNVDASGSSIKVSGFIVLSGNYPSGGDVLNFAAATADLSFEGILPAIISSSLLTLLVDSMGGSAIAGSSSTNYSPACTKTGTPATINPATGVKLKCAALGASPTTEHSAGAYESQYTGDIVAFRAVFTKNL